MVTVAPCQPPGRSWTSAYEEEDLGPGEELQASVPAVLLPLSSDWNSALAAWGGAWEVQLYGVGGAFSSLAVMSALGLLGLAARWPPGGLYFLTLQLSLLSFCVLRAFCLLYDAYGHQDRLPPPAALLLAMLPPPCLSSAFSLAFLLLPLHSCLHLSLSPALHVPFSALHRPFLLLSLSLLQFCVSLGVVLMLQVFPRLPVGILLFPRGLFVCLSVFLSCCYLAFYFSSQTNSKPLQSVEDGGESGESPDGVRPLSPAAEPRGGAAGSGLAASLCLLGLGGLQLYGVLRALGLGGGEGFGLAPWPWWGYQLGCRLCEVGACLALSLIATQPLLCRSSSSVQPPAQSRPGSWSRLSSSPSVPGLDPPSQSGSWPPVLPPRDGCSLQEQEKLLVIVLSKQSESLPLCSLEVPPGNGLQNAQKLVSTRTSLPLPARPSPPLCPGASGESQLSSVDSLALFSDSTVDLRPPSPIELSRSIEQALFSHSLFSTSIFQPSGLFCVSSRLSLTSPGQSTSRQRLDSGGSFLCRTSSCGAVDQQTPASKPCGHVTSEGQSAVWAEQREARGSLWSSPWGPSSRPTHPAAVRCSSWTKEPNSAQSGFPSAVPHRSFYRRYRTLSSASREGRGSARLSGTNQLSASRQLEWDLAVQAEFVRICRQMDALSLCSDTIDL